MIDFYAIDYLDGPNIIEVASESVLMAELPDARRQAIHDAITSFRAIWQQDPFAFEAALDYVAEAKESYYRAARDVHG